MDTELDTVLHPYTLLIYYFSSLLLKFLSKLQPKPSLEL